MIPDGHISLTEAYRRIYADLRDLTGAYERLRWLLATGAILARHFEGEGSFKDINPEYWKVLPKDHLQSIVEKSTLVEIVNRTAREARMGVPVRFVNKYLVIEETYLMRSIKPKADDEASTVESSPIKKSEGVQRSMTNKISWYVP